MCSFRRLLFPVTFLGALLMCGCTAEVSELKEKLAAMDKRLAKQDKMLAEFEKKFSVPKDFSVDVQRLEDEQEKLRELIKTRVEPMTGTVGDLKDWAREVQAERLKTAERVKQLEQFHAQASGAMESGKREMERIAKEQAENTNRFQKAVKTLQDQEKALAQLSKALKQMETTLQANNERILNAVKKTLPKVKEAAVAELKGDLDQLEKRVRQTPASSDGSPPEGLHMPTAPAAVPAEIAALRRQVKELEQIVANQKSDLLGVGNKVHELELRLKRQAAIPEQPVIADPPPPRTERPRRLH